MYIQEMYLSTLSNLFFLNVQHDKTGLLPNYTVQLTLIDAILKTTTILFYKQMSICLTLKIICPWIKSRPQSRSLCFVQHPFNNISNTQLQPIILSVFLGSTTSPNPFLHVTGHIFTCNRQHSGQTNASMN